MTEPGLLSCLFFYKKMFNSNVVKRKSNFLRNILIFVVTIVFISVGVFFIHKIISHKANTVVSRSKVIEVWKSYDYQEVYNLTENLLVKNPLNNFALVYHGYASFFLALSKLDSTEAQNLLDESINSLRIVLHDSKTKSKGQIEYILGKAYFYKNTVSSYYYSDLAIKYLEAARADGYKADDIPEYLGLSYAVLNKPMESISAFTEALIVRESFSLLLSIAEQYYKTNQGNVAKQYLFRIINNCNDDNLVNKSLNLLALIYIDEGSYSEARDMFSTMLKKNQNSADAYYGLGVIYEKQGDLVKARAEWRKALKVHVNHSGALNKLAQYN